MGEEEADDFGTRTMADLLNAEVAKERRRRVSEEDLEEEVIQIIFEVLKVGRGREEKGDDVVGGEGPVELDFLLLLSPIHNLLLLASVGSFIPIFSNLIGQQLSSSRSINLQLQSRRKMSLVVSPPVDSLVLLLEADLPCLLLSSAIPFAPFYQLLSPYSKRHHPRHP